MKAALLLCPLFVLSAIAEPGKPMRTGEVEVPLEPKNEKELKVWIDGTTWVTDDADKVPVTFAGGKFETPLNKGTYSIDNVRTITMNWGKGVKIQCKIDPKCTKMTELGGENHVFRFDGRKQAEEKPSKLPPKPEKK